VDAERGRARGGYVDVGRAPLPRLRGCRRYGRVGVNKKRGFAKEMFHFTGRPHEAHALVGFEKMGGDRESGWIVHCELMRTAVGVKRENICLPFEPTFVGGSIIVARDCGHEHKGPVSRIVSCQPIK
jgi:hypothetical protein